MKTIEIVVIKLRLNDDNHLCEGYLQLMSSNPGWGCLHFT